MTTIGIPTARIDHLTDDVELPARFRFVSDLIEMGDTIGFYLFGRWSEIVVTPETFNVAHELMEGGHAELLHPNYFPRHAA